MKGDFRARYESATGWFLTAIFILFVASAFLAQQAFAVLAAAGGLSLLGIVAPGRARTAGFLLLSLLCLWAVGPQLATFSHAPIAETYDQLERQTGLKLVLMAVLFPALPLGAGALSGGVRDRLAAVLALGVSGVACLVVIDALTGARIFTAIATLAGSPPRQDLAPVKAAQGAYAVAVLAAPVGLWLARRRAAPLIAVLAACLVAASLGLGADAPLAAGALALAVFAAILAWPRAGMGALAVLGAVYFIAAPSLARLLPPQGARQGLLPPSWSHRERIWRFVADRIFERPLTGHGLDASRGFGDSVPLHPHNGALQIWLELGGPGAMLAAALWLWLAWRITAMSDRAERAAAAGALAAYTLIGALSFGVWQEWWLALGAFAAAALALIRRSPL